MSAKPSRDDEFKACNEQISADALMAVTQFGEGKTFLALITAAITVAGAANMRQELVESIMTKAMLTLREHRRDNPQ